MSPVLAPSSSDPRQSSMPMDELLEWYDRVRRDLPWRRTPRPVRDPRLARSCSSRPRSRGWSRATRRGSSAGRRPTALRGRAARRRAAPSGSASATTAARCALWEAARDRSPADGWPERPADAARRRAVHGGGGRLVRVRPPGAGDRHQRAARLRALGRSARGRGGGQPGDHGARRDGVQGPRGALRRVPAGALRSAGPAGRAACARARERFEDSNRWVRGRVVAAMVGREPWPDGTRARSDRAGAGGPGPRRAHPSR